MPPVALCEYTVRKPAKRLIAGLLVSLMSFSGCGLPEPDGTEAAIAARAAGLTPVVPVRTGDRQAVIRNGLLLHPDVRQAASSVLASADDVRVQRGAIFPRLGLSVGGGVGDAGDGDTTFGLVGEQLLTDFGNSKRAITSADLDLQIDYVTFQKTVDDAVVELLLAYDAVHRYQQLLDIRQKQLAAMRELAVLVEERTTAGAASAPDLLETRKRLQTAEFLVQDSELGLGDAMDRLLRLAGQAKGGSLSLPPGACRIKDETDDLLIAKLRLKKSEIDVERADRARLPRITLSPVTETEIGDSGLGVGLNLGVSSDLLRGGALTAQAKAARNERVAALASVEAETRNADLDARKLQREIAAADRREEMLNRQIKLLSETRVLYRSQYFQLGSRQLSDLLDNEEEYYERQAELVELSSTLAEDRLSCAVLGRSLRKLVGLTELSLYGFPL